MGTTLNKLEYLDETKSQIKTALNQFNAGITDEATFREYVDKINDIYDSWEKVTGTGTDITLNNTKSNSKLQLNLKGNTIQDGTPTPDNPVNIEVVTGDNTIKVGNKNILKILADSTTNNGITYTNNENGSITINGTATNNSFYVLTNKTNNLGAYTNTLFTMQTNFYQQPENDTTNVQLLYRGTNSNYYNKNNVTSHEVGLVYLQVNNGVTINNLTVYPMIINGTTTGGEYKPHQEQTQLISLGSIELAKIGNYQDYLYYENGNWYKKEQIGKLIFNGSEAWTEQAQTGFARYGVTNTDIINDTSLVNNVLNYSNYFTGITFNQRNSSITNTIYTICNAVLSQSAFWINTTETTAYSSLETFKTWLSTHNLEVLYIKATLNDIPITNETLIEQLNAVYKSYEDQTNITSSYGSGNAPFIISASALKKGGN